MGRSRGFTLLELMIVVIIIGILSAMAGAQYLKTVEKSRMSEALSILGSMRSSELRFFAENNTYTGALTALDFNPADVAGTPVFAYSISGAGAANFVVVATRGAVPPLLVTTGCVAGYTIRISRAGTRCGTDCQTTALGCAP